MSELKPSRNHVLRTLLDSGMQEKLLFLGMLAVIVLNLTAAIIATGSLRNSTQARNAARQSTNTNIELAGVYSSLRDAESGQRGYILTDDPSYLDPYHSGSKAAPNYIAQLQPQFKGTNEEAEMTQLSRLSSEKLQELAYTLELNKDQGFDAALAVIKTNRGEATMDQVQSLLATMERQVNTKTAARDRTASRFATIAYACLLASAIFTFCLVYFMRNIFLRIKFQAERLELTNIELERSNRELQDFASIASHDLQEPLRKIQAFGDRLSVTTTLSGDSELYLDRMLSAAGRMRVLIDDLLTYSRVTTKAKPFKRVSLRRIIKEVISDMEVRIAETSAEITVGKLPAIEADGTQMRQMFQNLISNAIKFRKEGSEPHIGISSITEGSGDQGLVTISVTDTGIGFDQKYADRIFTIFQRLHGRNEYEGTGIGLAVVRKIAERHGGTVTATSEVGKGSRFDITLPMRHKDL